MSVIEWTDETWNPVTGCSRVSPGCDHCYALTMAARLKAMGQPHYQRDGQPPRSGPGFGVSMHHNWVRGPGRWKRPRKVFVCSMSDLFHEEVSDDFLDAVFFQMEVYDQHTYQVLTKRPRRMESYLRGRWKGKEPPSHIWLGTSVEDQERANLRIPSLLRMSAAIRFLSCEPLLGPVDLNGLWGYPGSADGEMLANWPIRWLIIGGESGPGARVMELDWARSIIKDCQEARVPVFVKQLGAVWARENSLGTTKGGEMSRWPADLRVRETP